MGSFITNEETKRLEDNYNYRKQMVENAFKNGTPTEARDIEVINGVLNSMDKAIYDSVTSRLKHEENQNKGAILSVVSEALRTISNNKNNVINSEDRMKELENLNLPLNIVEGELDINDRKFELNEILKEEE